MSKTFDAALPLSRLPGGKRASRRLWKPTARSSWAGRLSPECEDTPEMNAEDIAALIAAAVNGNQKNEEVITELVGALETCLECDGKLDFSAEQEADAALRAAGERARTSKTGRSTRSRQRPGN